VAAGRLAVELKGYPQTGLGTVSLVLESFGGYALRLSIVGEFKRGRVWPIAFALVALLAIPARASATVLTYVPSASTSGSNDLGDLSLSNYYAWTISQISIPTNQTITSASITFTNLYNWDTTKNVLYLDLLDGAVTSGGTPLVSGTGTTGNGANADTYTSTVRYAADPSLSGDAFDSANLLTTGAKTDLGGTTQWSVVSGKGGLYNYTYTFTSSELTALKAYIANGGNITLALDPDLTFYNDGVSFSIGTGTPLVTNPEPASLILLGTGLLFSVNQYRRRRTKKPSK
jgi:hypothetical protein